MSAVKPSAPMNWVREIRNLSNTLSITCPFASDADWFAASAASNRWTHVWIDSGEESINANISCPLAIQSRGCPQTSLVLRTSTATRGVEVVIARVARENDIGWGTIAPTCGRSSHRRDALARSTCNVSLWSLRTSTKVYRAIPTS